MPLEHSQPEALPDEGTVPVLQQHYPPDRGGAEPDPFRSRLQAAAERFGLSLHQLPGQLLVPQYDAVLIGDRAADLPAMERVRDLIREVRYDDGTAPRILLNEPLAGQSASFLSWLGAANARSTFVFIYVTNSFLRNHERLQYLERLYTESMSGPLERRSRIVPIFAEGVDPSLIETIPEAALFQNLAGLPLVWVAGQPQLEQRQRFDLRRLLRDRLGQRRQREDEQIEAVQNYAAGATRQQGSRMLQQFSDFFTQRMGLSADEVKRQLAFFRNQLEQMGEPEAVSQPLAMQEVGSQQMVDSGLPQSAPPTPQTQLPAGQHPLRQQPQPQSAAPAAPPARAAAGAAAAAPAAPALADVIRGVETMNVGSASQLSVRGTTVHVHVTYVQQFVAGATQAHQHVVPGQGDSAQQQPQQQQPQQQQQQQQQQQ